MKRILLVLSLLYLNASLSAENPDFNGSWNTNWGQITLEQDGRRVIGNYSGEFSGTITGTVRGNRLDFEWKQPNGQWGRGYFVLEGNSFTGMWGHGESSDNGGPWNGKRNSK